MIIVLDYGMGNPGSMLNMFRRIGAQAVVASDHDTIMSASAIVLPGVGSFDNGMQKLLSSGILEPLKQRVLHDKVPFLGVCLGMQLLFESSEEGLLPGLGWIPGHVKRFDFSNTGKTGLKIPHMGWNLVRPANGDSLFRGLDEESRFYFVHSYHVVCSDTKHLLGTSDYGYQFVSAVQKENIFGVQFHPEKSHRFGMTLLKNFSELASC
jgi:imidazole glycerol-phosphate synthase subunit HisH